MATKSKRTSEDQKNRANNQTASNSPAIDLLEQDHRQVEQFFEAYEKLQNVNEKEELALKICMSLQVHTQIEEETFYPVAREALDSPELIDEAIVEHAAAKQLIAELEEMDPNDELYDAKVKVLGEQVSHHVDEEENQLFPQLEKSEVDLEALGQKLAERKEALLRQLAEQGDAA
jgi:hemerythrin-like domain-containing protein